MATNDVQFPIPSETQFEEQVLALAAAIYEPLLPPQFVGRRGQDQQGIDIILQDRDGRWIGIQCKRYIKTKLTAAIVQSDLDAAHEVTPPLSVFIVAARCDRDASLQASVRQMTLHGEHGAVSVWSWPDLVLLLEQHDLLHTTLSGIAPKHLLRAFEAQVGPVSFIGGAAVTVAPSDDDPPWLSEVNRLLGRARPFSALAALDQIQPTASEVATHAAARLRCLIGMARYDQAVSEVEGATSPSPLQLAYGALAAIRLGNDGLASKWIERAKASASSKERRQVWSLSISIHVVDDKKTLKDVIDELPEDLLNSREIAQALGDLAMAQDRDLEAIDWLERAEALEPGASLPRQLKLASARIALAFSHTPLGAAAPTHPDDVHFAEVGRASLANMVNDLARIEDTQARVALLNNLSLAELLTGDPQSAARHAAEAVRQDQSDVGMWNRYLAMLLSSSQKVDTELLQFMPDDGELHLRSALIHRFEGRPEDAVASLEKARAAGFIDDGIESELFRLANPGHLDGNRAAELSEKVLAAPPSIPVAALALEYINDPEMAPYREEILGSLRKMAAREELPLHGRFVLGSMLRDQGCTAEAIAYLPVVEALLFRGSQFDPTVAEVLVSLLLLDWRHHRSDEVANVWLRAYPNDIRAIIAKANVLTSRGLYSEFWTLLDEAIGRGVVTPAILENFAHVSIATGRLRQAARRVRGATLPPTEGAAAFRRVFLALSVFRDPRIRGLLTEGLKPGRIDQTNAAALFGLGVRRFRGTPRGTVAADTLITIAVPGRSDRTIWVGNTASPLPGVVQLPPSSWVSALLGHRVGDTVPLTEGPFAGNSALITEVSDTAQIFMKASRDVAMGVGLSAGGVDEISASSTSELVEQMRAAIAAQDTHLTTMLALAKDRGLPASVMSTHFKKPARAFIERSGVWRPATHLGTAEAIAKDAEVIRETQRFILDPIAVMTVVQTRMESIVLAFGRPVISPQTRVVLRKHYFEERDDLRAAGRAHVTARGQLRITEVGPLQRSEHRRYWKRVGDFCRSCETIECESDSDLAAVGHYENVIDAGAVSSFALGKEHGWTLLSEERGLRDLAAEAGVRAASLQRLIANHFEEYPEDKARSALAMSALASLGGWFTSVPAGIFLAALELDGVTRKRALKALLSSLQSADQTAIPILAQLFARAQSLAHAGRPTVGLKWLLREICSALPEIARTPKMAKAIEIYLAKAYGGRRFRAFRRALVRAAHKPKAAS